jgi:branched-chain amino acid transport system permease protein
VTRERVGLAFLAAVIALLPLVASTDYYLNVLNFVGLYAIVTLGLILLGCSGQVSLGQAAFYGLGAYASALLSRDLGWTPWLTIPLAIVAVAGVAYVVGLPTLRLAEHFFVLATLGFGIIVNVLMVQLLTVTGGGNGLRDIPPLQIAGLRLMTDRQFYYPIWTLTFITLVLARNITSHRTGRALRAILGSEVAAAALGVEVARYKMQVFVLSAAFAALAGAVYAHYIRFISPSPFALYASLFFLIMAVVGGLTNIWGGLFGAALVTILDQVIRAQVPRVFPGVGGEYQTAIYGILLVLIMIFFPRGIVRGALDLRHALTGHPLPAPRSAAEAEPVEGGRA